MTREEWIKRLVSAILRPGPVRSIATDFAMLMYVHAWTNGVEAVREAIVSTFADRPEVLDQIAGALARDNPALADKAYLVMKVPREDDNDNM
jgi:hypothetical protein